MSGSSSPLAELQAEFQAGTPASLAEACILNPRFCRTFFTLPRLVEVVREHAGDLLAAGRLDPVRDEVVFRLLVTADRSAYRPLFLELLDLEWFADPALRRFAAGRYHPRSESDFARSEGRYLDALRSAYTEAKALREPVFQTLRWFGVAPGERPRNQFRGLFSNPVMQARFPGIFLPAACVRFVFKGNNGPHPFDLSALGSLGDGLVNAARDAEIHAHAVHGRALRGVHKRLGAEPAPEELSLLDGSSGYLPFLMAHLCLIEGVPLSPYVGFIAARDGQGKLAPVADLPAKLVAACHAGLRVAFVPTRDYLGLTLVQQHGYQLIRVLPFDDGGHVGAVADRLLTMVRNVQAEITLPGGVGPPPVPPPPLPLPPRPAPAVPPLPRVAAAPGLPSQPQRLFGRADLTAFEEIGGYAGPPLAAEFSVFNSEDDTFLTLHADGNRLQVFDLFGERRLSHVSNSPPLSAAWRAGRSEYLVGFEDGTVRRFTPRLEEKRGRITLPSGFLPRRVVDAGGDLFVSDGREALLRIGADRSTRLVGHLGGSVGDLAFSEVRDELVLALPRALVGLSRAGAEVWRVPYQALSAAVACPDNGDVWAALSTGRLIRLAGDGLRILVNAAVPARARSLVVLDRAAVLGCEHGELLLFDLHGLPGGRDELKVRLNHLCGGEGDVLVASTGCGPCVLKPSAARLAADEAPMRERVVKTIREWERVGEGAAPEVVIRTFVTALDLASWPEVLSMQDVFVERLRANPEPGGRLEQAMRRADARKAACLTTRTRPVFLDGGDVCRQHVGAARDGWQRAKLAAISRLRGALLKETDPVRYPLITVLDLGCRREIDDHAGLLRQIAEGAVIETPSERETAALILSLIKRHGWLDCEVVSNNARLLADAHEALPGADPGWYERVRRAFRIHPKTNEVTITARGE